MANTVQIKGAAALIQWGYHAAATLGAWTVARDSDVWTFSARIVDLDDFRMSQRPLVVVTPNGWRWPVIPESLQVVDGTLTAALRPEKET